MSRPPARITQADVARESVVYFVRIGRHVKIGMSRNIAGRLKAFQTSAADVELLLTVPGGRELEQKFHELLSDVRIAREIFQPDSRIHGFIDHFSYGGLERGLRYLEEMTPHYLKKAKEEARKERVRVARQSRAEKDAYFASLVEARKAKLGW